MTITLSDYTALIAELNTLRAEVVELIKERTELIHQLRCNQVTLQGFRGN